MLLKRSLVWTNRILTQRRDGNPFFCQLGGGQTQFAAPVSAAMAGVPADTAAAAAPKGRVRRSIKGDPPSSRASSDRRCSGNPSSRLVQRVLSLSDSGASIPSDAEAGDS